VARFENCSGGLLAKKLPETHILKYQAGEIPVTEPLVLPSQGSEVQGFAVCGADRVWKWAQAEIIDGGRNGEVRVWSPEVAEPAAVRYAWADNPTCNLFNGSGLPAAPFRSDVPAAK
jgi:sialate O-acetylesterase